MYTSPAPVYRAHTLAEAVALRAAHPTAMPLAGGTDVMVFLEAHSIHPPAFLDLWPCTELRGVSADGTRIGALTTWTTVARANVLPAALRECARTVGAVQIQNRGTVGGNIANASPAGDSLPLWLALDATFELVSTRGSRRVPASEFWLGYRKTALAADELVVAVHLPAALTGPDAPPLHYRKVGTRLAQAISKVVLGARIVVEDGVVTEARVAFGSVAPVPMRARTVEAALVGRPVDPSVAALVAALVQADIAPIDDVRSNVLFRRKVSENLLRGWLEAVAQGRDID